jgi:hypothetical protein
MQLTSAESWQIRSGSYVLQQRSSLENGQVQPLLFGINTTLEAIIDSNGDTKPSRGVKRAV